MPRKTTASVVDGNEQLLLMDFQAAAKFVKQNANEVQVSDVQKLTLYGLFKQVTCGPNKTSKPGVLGGFVKRAKWKAWASVKDLTRDVAARKYVDIVQSLAPEWKPPSKIKIENEEQESASSSSSSSSSDSESDSEAVEESNTKTSSLKKNASGELSHISLAFNQACSHFMSHLQHTSSDEEKLVMYGLFKQSTTGTNNTPKPSMMSGMVKRAKWNSWNKYKGLSKVEAKKQYVHQIQLLDPSWTPSEISLDQNESNVEEVPSSPTPMLDNDLALKFKKACAYVCNTPSLLDHKGKESKTSLELYGLWKYGTIGPNRAAKPSVMISGVKRAKWFAWTRCNSMTQKEARERYIQIVERERAKKLVSYVAFLTYMYYRKA